MLGYSTLRQLPPTASRTGSAACDASTRRPHILVVDDDPTNRRVLQGMLGRLGYACSTVDDGAKAVRAVEDGQYDAVLMDCLMPVMDGYDATRAIRGAQLERVQVGARRLPVIAVTALEMQGARDRCLEAGMDDYLTKPVLLASLERVLGRWIGGEREASAWIAAKGTQTPPVEGPIDVHMLDELLALGEETGPELIADLVREFGNEVPARFPLMRAALAAEDMAAFLRELHFVAGCSSIVGARHVEQLARSVDSRDLPASVAAAMTLVGRLEAAYSTAYACLTDIVASSQA